MAASCCGLRAARSEAGSNNDSGVSCKQPGKDEKDVGGVVVVPYTRQPKRKRYNVAHDSTRLGLELQHLDAAAGKAQTGHALIWRADTTLRPATAIPPSAWLATD